MRIVAMTICPPNGPSIGGKIGLFARPTAGLLGNAYRPHRRHYGGSDRTE